MPGHGSGDAPPDAAAKGTKTAAGPVSREVVVNSPAPSV